HRQCRRAGAALAVPAAGDGEGRDAPGRRAQPEGARGQGVAARAGLFQQAGGARLRRGGEGRAGGAGALAEGQEHADALVPQPRVRVRVPQRQGQRGQVAGEVPPLLQQRLRAGARLHREVSVEAVMKLIIEDDDGRKTVVPVVRDEITIGRNDGNIVRLPEKNVSRQHGRLLRESGHYYIEDLNSFTGIRVNGEKIAGKHVVQDGDLIQISEYDLILEEGPDDRAPPPVPQADTEAQARRMAETATIRLSDLRPTEVELPPQEIPLDQRARLVGISGKHRGEELVLSKSPIRLGRSDENDLQIDHPSISRKHLRLHLDKGTWKVMDAESRNG